MGNFELIKYTEICIVANCTNFINGQSEFKQ